MWVSRLKTSYSHYQQIASQEPRRTLTICYVAIAVSLSGGTHLKLLLHLFELVIQLVQRHQLATRDTIGR